MTPEQKKIRAEAANQILENSTFIEAFDIIKGSIIDSNTTINPKNVEDLQENARTLQNLNRLLKTLEHVMTTGQMIKKHESKLKLFNR